MCLVSNVQFQGEHDGHSKNSGTASRNQLLKGKDPEGMKRQEKTKLMIVAKSLGRRDWGGAAECEVTRERRCL